MVEACAWQQALRDVVTDPQELMEMLDLDPALFAHEAAKGFALKVPREFIARMRPNDPRDPLLLQVLPLHAELSNVAGYTSDPLQELHANPRKGLLHKYKNRVLVTLTSACAIHCRYCFRRHFPYADNNPGTAGWRKIIDYVRQDTAVNEVILSGGDPLITSDQRLQVFIDEIATIPHVSRLRIHTRLPIVLPSRVTPSLIAAITHSRLAVVMVIHTNHAQEIDETVERALRLLKEGDITLLNQSVMLRGVNDKVDVLVELSEKLFAARVLPYYLHVLDKTAGTAHFDLPRATAISLHQQMQAALPGYLVPRLVVEEAGQPNKTLVSPLDPSQ